MIPGIDPYSAIANATAPEREALRRHLVSRTVATPRALALFMETHVYVVWSALFLRNALTPAADEVTVPAHASRFGQARADLDSYLAAMNEVGADVRPIEMLVAAVARGGATGDALALVPAHARSYVRAALTLVASGDEIAIAASFLALGGEEGVADAMARVIPVVAEAGRVASLRLCLDRYATFDGSAYASFARRVLTTLCGGDPRRWRAAREASVVALRARIELWSGDVPASVPARAPSVARG